MIQKCDSISYNNSLSAKLAFKSDNADNMTAPDKKQKNNLQQNVETTIDNINTKIENEKKKKSNKIAIISACSAITLSIIVALFNPSFSPKLATKIQTLRQNFLTRREKNKKNFVKSNFYRGMAKVLDISTRTMEFMNNGNSVKDIYFKNLCLNKMDIKADEKFLKKGFKKTYNFFAGISSSIHKGITKCGDNLAKLTVKSKYKMSVKQMDSFEKLILRYKDRLTPAEQGEIDNKLSEIKTLKQYYSKENVEQRLNAQESIMENLESDVKEYFRQFREKLTNGKKLGERNFQESFNFWAQEAIKDESQKVEAKGLEEISKLIGNGKDKQGLYNEIIEIFSKSSAIDEMDKKVLKKCSDSVCKNIQTANNKECTEYLAKKRDLILGSAPTDIVTALVAIGASGIAIGKADDKEERISRVITKAAPAVIGVGTSIALTAGLVSGAKNLILSGAIGFIVSKIGNIVNKKIFGVDIDKKTKTQEQNIQPTNNNDKNEKEREKA